jgi:hypothetical protein
MCQRLFFDSCVRIEFKGLNTLAETDRFFFLQNFPYSVVSRASFLVVVVLRFHGFGSVRSPTTANVTSSPTTRVVSIDVALNPIVEIRLRALRICT